MDTNRKISIIILGAGGRGTIYANLIRHMRDKVQVVAVAEPRAFFRNRIAEAHHVPELNRFTDWHDVLKRPKFADAVIITTQDRMHRDPAVAFAEKGYHILIEKPLASDAESCRQIVNAVEQNHVTLSACHVLRYTNGTRMLRKLILDGTIGKILSIEHLEPVGHWRYAHSYVRGNWNREKDSSSVLLAKSIHDLDWISFIIGDRCKSISSFGSLMFFRHENRPEKAADRCLDCPLEPQCAYSAPRFYLKRWKEGHIDNYIESVASPLTEENILHAMREGPYGRCVFACDNDVADHQVVSMEFEHGATAVFTLAGCSRYSDRRTTIFGSEGEICCDGEQIRHFSYLTGKTSILEIEPDDGTPEKYHGGGDKNCLECFIDAIREHRPELIVSDAETSLETHLMVFAAERSRLENRTIFMDELRLEKQP